MSRSLPNLLDPTPDGRFVDTPDGRRLHVEQRGTGHPVVVFESGLGGSRSAWGAVEPIVRQHTSTVVYDRSGYGRSPRDPAGRDLSRLADDLTSVLDAVGPAPFVLVGHSWGGPIIRAAAHRAGSDATIAGLVLVDQTDESCDLFLSAANERQARWFTKATPWLGRLGIFGLFVKRTSAQLPEPARGEMREEGTTPNAIRTYADEMVTTTADLRRLRDAPLVLPDVPVTWISGGKSSRLERGRRGELIAAHRAGAEAASQGRHVVAERSGHLVPFSEPQLVADEILRIVDAGASAGTETAG